MYNNTFFNSIWFIYRSHITLIWVLSSYHHHYLIYLHILYYFDIANRIHFVYKFCLMYEKYANTNNSTKWRFYIICHYDIQKHKESQQSVHKREAKCGHRTLHIIKNTELHFLKIWIQKYRISAVRVWFEFFFYKEKNIGKVLLWIKRHRTRKSVGHFCYSKMAYF